MAIEPFYTGAKFVHVVFAGAWIGLVGVHAVVMGRLLRASTPATRREFTGRFMPAALRWGNILGGFTLLSGLATTYAAAGELRFAGEWGRFVAFALIVNLAVLYLLNVAIGRSWKVVEREMAKEPVDLPPPARIQFLERRIAVNVWLSLFLLVFAAFSMVLADATGAP